MSFVYIVPEIPWSDPPVPLSPARRRVLTGLAVMEEGAVRMAPLLVVPELLTEMGLDPGRLIAEAGLDPALFADPENTIAFADGGRALTVDQW